MPCLANTRRTSVSISCAFAVVSTASSASIDCAGAGAGSCVGRVLAHQRNAPHTPMKPSPSSFQTGSPNRASSALRCTRTVRDGAKSDVCGADGGWGDVAGLCRRRNNNELGNSTREAEGQMRGRAGLRSMSKKNFISLLVTIHVNAQPRARNRTESRNTGSQGRRAKTLSRVVFFHLMHERRSGGYWCTNPEEPLARCRSI